MAEAFGIAAGAVTVIEITAKVISKCKHIIRTTHDAPKDLRNILIEVSSLQATLESLDFLSTADCDFADAVKGLANIEGAITGCRDTMEDLAAELDGLAISGGKSSSSGKRQRLKGSLAWCLKESKARKLLNDAIQHKSTINLALVGEVAKDIKELKASTAKIQEDISSSRQREICDWLESFNPTRDHNIAKNLREDHTCRWLLRQQEWNDWLLGSRRFVWIHGIPGAGKTILASFAIEQAIKTCSQLQVSNACIYYYCSYRQTEDQTLSFLRWVVSQLCRKLGAIPEEIVRLHKDNAEPATAQLKEGLKALLQKVGVIYVLLDAVDECSNRNELLDVLAELVTEPAYARLRLLATSRNYLDISETFSSLAASISMDNPLVGEDIRLYAQHELRTNRKTSWWSPALALDVVDSIVKGAKGMFRWASCQLYILTRKRSEGDIREILVDMPETLDEMYARIILQIPKEDREYARKALMWICMHDMLPFTTGIPANCLASIVFPGYVENSLESNERHVVALQDICGCLIRKSTFDFSNEIKGKKHIKEDFESYHTKPPLNFETISLAHYTVREFLFSNRITGTTDELAEFSMTTDNVICECIQTALDTCASLDLETAHEYYFVNFSAYSREIIRIAPFRWEEILLRDEFLGLCLRIFKVFEISRTDIPSVYHWEIFHENGPWIYQPQIQWDLSENIASPHVRDSLVLLHLLVCDLFGLANKFLQQHDPEVLIFTPMKVKIRSSTPLRPASLRPASVELSVFEALKAEHLKHYQDEFLEEHLEFFREHIESIVWFSSMLTIHNEETCLQCYDSNYEGNGKSPRFDISASLPSGSNCFLLSLLDDIVDSGINFDFSLLRMTPLQIAVYFWDVMGVKLLIEKGVESNAIGSPAGKHLPHFDYRWSHCSPLHIIRYGWSSPGRRKRAAFLDFGGVSRNAAGEDFSHHLRAIERALINDSAEDFVKNEFGVRIYEGSSVSLLYVEDEDEVLMSRELKQPTRWKPCPCGLHDLGDDDDRFRLGRPDVMEVALPQTCAAQSSREESYRSNSVEHISDTDCDRQLSCSSPAL